MQIMLKIISSPGHLGTVANRPNRTLGFPGYVTMLLIMQAHDHVTYGGVYQ